MSSVDKKIKEGEKNVFLCNYMDVYSRRFIRSDIPFMTATATEREIERCTLQVDDVVITKDSEKHDDIGVPALIRENVENLVCGYHLAILRPSIGKLHGPYLYYALQTEDVRHQFHSYANGVTRFGLRKDDMYRVEISLPPLPKQRAIARILGTLDDKIEINRRMNDTLEAMARALLKSWFVDFDPVRAKMEGRDTRLPKHLADLFPDALDDEDKPVGWRRERIGKHIIATKGISYKGAGLTDKPRGMPLHNLNSILEGGGYKSEGLKFYSGDFKPRHIVRPGDLIVANTEQGFDHLLVGYSALVPAWAGMEGLYSHHIFKVEPRPASPLSPVWLHFALCAARFGEAIRRFSNGTTVNMLPRDAFEIPEIIVPPSALVRAFEKFVEPTLRKQEDSVVESEILIRTRDLLLQKLMSGEIRLTEAHNAVEAVA